MLGLHSWQLAEEASVCENQVNQLGTFPPRSGWRERFFVPVLKKIKQYYFLGGDCFRLNDFNLDIIGEYVLRNGVDDAKHYVTSSSFEESALPSNVCAVSISIH